jgi:hypothetical protein
MTFMSYDEIIYSTNKGQFWSFEVYNLSDLLYSNIQRGMDKQHLIKQL